MLVPLEVITSPMPIKRKDFEKVVLDFKEEVVSGIERHTTLLSNFHQDGDWAFVIKTHALLEAVVSESLLREIGDARLRSFIGRTSISQRVKLAEQLDLLSKPQVRFVTKFTALRNQLVHDLECTNFDFPKYVVGLSDKDRSDLTNSVIWQKVDQKTRDLWSSRMVVTPKLVVVVFMLKLLSMTCLKSLETSGGKRIKQLSGDTAEDYFERLSGRRHS